MRSTVDKSKSILLLGSFTMACVGTAGTRPEDAPVAASPPERAPVAASGAETAALQTPPPIGNISTCSTTDPAAPVDLLLFVTGLNHQAGEVNGNVNNPVTQNGVDELAELVHQVAQANGGSLDNVVVALSESSPQKFGECKSGPKHSEAGRTPRNGECLAFLLSQRLNRHFDIYQTITESNPDGGYALITSTRWRLDRETDSFEKFDSDPADKTLVVRLIDQVSGKTLPLYLMHTSAAEGGVNALLKARTHALKAFSSEWLPPLFVGDFNICPDQPGSGCSIGAHRTAELQRHFAWINRGVACHAAADGTSCPGANFSEKIQAFSGRNDTEEFGAKQQLRRLQISFSSDASQAITEQFRGIQLPHVAHGVLAIGLGMDPTPRCTPCKKTQTCDGVCPCPNGQACNPEGTCDRPRCRPPVPIWCDAAEECVKSKAVCAGHAVGHVPAPPPPQPSPPVSPPKPKCGVKTPYWCKTTQNCVVSKTVCDNHRQ